MSFTYTPEQASRPSVLGSGAFFYGKRQRGSNQMPRTVEHGSETKGLGSETAAHGATYLTPVPVI